MIPGIFSKLSEQVLASATTIAPKAEFVRLTGTTAIATITPPNNGGFATAIILVPTAGAIATTTAGNITVVVTMADLRATLLVWSPKTAKWYPGAIS